MINGSKGKIARRDGLIWATISDSLTSSETIIITENQTLGYGFPVYLRHNPREDYPILFPVHCIPIWALFDFEIVSG
jgi:hypothetical protein